jgi:Kef-type K+ transport system membrane component KefB
MWGYTGAIVAIAALGKLTGAALTARATGMNWKDSLALGVLMNTRGLVELVILSAGLDLGILSPPLFAMMVIMALLTTLMTTPILSAMKIRPHENSMRR